MKLTIKEIAELAQVSKGTVSKALNGQPGVGPETRERIMKLVRNLGYQPSSTARALSLRKTGNIGLIIPHEAASSLNGAYWSTIITAIAQAASLHEYNLLLLTPRSEGDIASAYERALKSRSVDGLIIGSELLDKRSISELLLHDTPFVLIGKNPEVSHYYVDVNNEDGAYRMTKYMVSRGFRKICFICGPLEYNYNRERISGFRMAAREHALSDFCIGYSSYDTGEVRETVQKLMHVHHPDSIFIGAGGDFMLDVLDACREFDVDFSSFGLSVFDDYFFLDYLQPRLTAVRQPLPDIGEAAVRMLFELFTTPVPVRDHIILPTSIVVRESCREKSI